MLNCLGNFGQSLYGALWALRGFWTLWGELWIVAKFLNLLWHFHQLAIAKSVHSSLSHTHVSSPAWSHSQTVQIHSPFTLPIKPSRHFTTDRRVAHTYEYLVNPPTVWDPDIFGPSGNEPQSKPKKIENGEATSWQMRHKISMPARFQLKNRIKYKYIYICAVYMPQV